MIGLLSGPGSPARRLAGEIVPAGIGVAAGATAATFLGLVGGLLVGLSAWLAASFVLARVRRYPTARRVYRALVLLHVLFWTARGVVLARPEATASPRTAGRLAWPAPESFRAGVATRPFALPPGTTLAGWGAGPRRRTVPAFFGLGVLGRLSHRLAGAPAPGAPPRAHYLAGPTAPGDVLSARALVLRPDGGGAPVAFVRLDLVVVDPGLVDAVLRRAPLEGLGRDGLLLFATHTHSGPGGAVHAPLAEVLGAGRFDARVFDAVADAAAGAIEEAAQTAREARLSVVEASDLDPEGLPGLVRGRGEAADEEPAADRARIDPRVLALRFDDAGGGGPIAVLVSYGVMPVMLRPRHLAFDRDLAGAIEDALSDALPGRPPVLFANGAPGDTTPRRGTESGHEAARRLADAFARRVAGDLAGPGRTAAKVAVRAARVRLDPGTPFGLVGVGSRPALEARFRGGAFGPDLPAVVADVVALPANVLVWSLGIPEARVLVSFDGAVGAAVRLDGVVPPAAPEVGAIRLEDADGHPLAVVLWEGGVATQAVLRTWRARAESEGLFAPLVVGLANGAAGYLVSPAEWDEGGYEALSSIFGRDGAAEVEAGLFLALRDAP